MLHPARFQEFEFSSELKQGALPLRNSLRRRYLCSSAVDTVLRIFSKEAYPVSGFRVKLLGHVDKLGLGILSAVGPQSAWLWRLV